jgi:hypothetical protein
MMKYERLVLKQMELKFSSKEQRLTVGDQRQKGICRTPNDQICTRVNISRMTTGLISRQPAVTPKIYNSSTGCEDKIGHIGKALG